MIYIETASENYKNNILDVFRIVATVQVFFGHIVTHFLIPQAEDAVYFVRGVPILFVLCGFLAAMSIENYNTKVWLVRRAQRILPAFWACIIFNSIIVFLVYSVRPSFKEALIYFVTQFFGLNFYTGSWLRDYGVGTPNGVLWTISVQIQFFILVPLIKRIMAKKRLMTWIYTIIGLTLLSMVIYRLQYHMPEIVYKLINVTVLPYMYFLLFGMMGWYQRDKIIPALRKIKYPLLFAYIIWKIAEDTLKFPKIFDGVLYNTITTLILCAVIFAFAFPQNGGWRMKTDLSYGFYLYHMIFIGLAFELGYTTLAPFSHGIVIIAVITVLTLVSSWLSLKFVEKPCATLLIRKMKI